MKKIIIAIVSSFMLVGCSTGGSDSNQTEKVSEGVAIDGILSGSTVCIDTNNDRKCSDESISNQDITDERGKFNITSTSSGPLIVIGGTDIGTGLPFTGLLKAPSGSKVITPLTSLVQSLVESGESVADAETFIKKALKIDDSISLTTLDPLEAIEDTNLSVPEREKARTLLSSQAQMQTVVHAISVTIAQADENKDISGVMSNAFDQIAKSFNNTTNEVNITKEIISTATREVANKIFEDNQEAKVAVKSIADNIADITVSAAAETRKSIESEDINKTQDSFNSTIKTANTTLQYIVNKEIQVAIENIVDLNESVIIAIDNAQLKIEEKEAEIKIQESHSLITAENLLRAQEEAENTEDKSIYDAYLLAKLENEKAIAEKNAAQIEMEIEAAKAAILEAVLKEDENQARIEALNTLEAANNLKTAQDHEATVKIEAAQEAQESAVNTTNLEEAKAAALEVEEDARDTIEASENETLIIAAQRNQKPIATLNAFEATEDTPYNIIPQEKQTTFSKV